MQRQADRDVEDLATQRESGGRIIDLLTLFDQGADTAVCYAAAFDLGASSSPFYEAAR